MGLWCSSHWGEGSISLPLSESRLDMWLPLANRSGRSDGVPVLSISSKKPHGTLSEKGFLKTRPGWPAVEGEATWSRGKAARQRESPPTSAKPPRWPVAEHRHGSKPRSAEPPSKSIDLWAKISVCYRMLLWFCDCVLCSIVVTTGNRYIILFRSFICISLLHYHLHKSSIDEHWSNRNNNGNKKNSLGLLPCTRQHAKRFSSIFSLNPHNCYVWKAASKARPSGAGSLVFTPSCDLLPWSVGQT